MAQTLGAVGDGEGSIQVLVHQHRTAGQCGAPAYPFNLQAQVLNAHRVVLVHGTYELQREDQVQISAGTAHKRTATFLSRDLETSVELGNVVLAQEVIGGFQSMDYPQPQVLRPPP